LSRKEAKEPIPPQGRKKTGLRRGLTDRSLAVERLEASFSEMKREGLTKKTPAASDILIGAITPKGLTVAGLAGTGPLNRERGKGGGFMEKTGRQTLNAALAGLPWRKHHRVITARAKRKEYSGQCLI